MKTSNKNRNSSFNSMLLIILVIIIFSSQVSALQITAVNAPEIAQIGTNIELSFTTDQLSNKSILIDDNLVNNSDFYSWSLTSSNLGSHSLKFIANNSNESAIEERTIMIEGVPPQFTIIKPNQSDYNTNNVDILLESSEAQYCYYTYEENTHTLTKNNNEFSDSIIGKEGVSSLILKCVRDNAITQKEINLHIDTMAPKIISKSPSGTIDKQQLTLEVETDEVSTCKFGTSQDDYDSLTLLGEEESITHSTSLTLDDGNYNYYVLCKDVYDNLMTNYETIPFTIRNTPKAAIEIEGENVKKAGTYKVTLTASEDLKETPTLSYKYQDSGSSKTIALIMMNDNPREYEGHIIIPEDAGEDIAQFSFKGVDLDNNEGTQITSGNLFRIDTDKPGKVSSFKGDLLDKRVVLNWFFDAEEDVTFNIYRAEKSGVSYTDYYKSTTSKDYIDNQLEEGKTYYYKVAVEDEAGNIGTLSNEGVIIVKPENTPEVNTRDPKDLYVIEDMEKLVKAKQLDVNGLLTSYNSENDMLKSEVIKELGIIEKLNEANLELKNLEKELSNIKTADISNEDFDYKIDEFNTRINNIDNLIFKDFDIESSVDYNELISEAELSAITDVFLRSNSGNKKEVIKDSRQLSEQINIYTKIVKIKVTTLNDINKNLILVIKDFNSNEPLKDLFLVESIPPQFSDKFSYIVFSKKPLVLEDDYVQYSFDNFQSSHLSYYAESDEEINNVRSLRSVFYNKYSDLDISTDNNDNLITANAVSFNINDLFKSSNLFMLLGVIVIAGLLVYYFMIDHSVVDNSNSGANAIIPALSQAISTGLINNNNNHNYIHPDINRNNPKKIIVKRLKEDSLNELLMLANRAADDNHYLDAKHYYKKALGLFEKENFFSEQAKKTTSDYLTMIYHKLMMIKSINDSHEAINAEDYESLEKNMNKMRYLSSKIDKDSYLMTHANNHYDYFYNNYQKLRRNTRVAE